MVNRKRTAFLSLTASALVLAACGEATEEEEELVDGDEIELVYVNWDTEIASTHVIGTVIEDMGYDVTITPLDNSIMWQSIATGESDAMVSAWLPQTHAAQLEEHEDDIDSLGINLEGGVVGYTVPEYMDVDSVEDLTDEANQTVTGIEAGSETVLLAEEVTESYDNLEDWEVVPSSSGAMATSLGQAIEDEEEIVVTGWTPHWKFQIYDLKMLDEPLNINGEDEDIETFARLGFDEDHPVAHSILENFYWELDDIEDVMLDIHEGAEPEQAARDWVDENQETVEEWTTEAEEIAE